MEWAKYPNIAALHIRYNAAAAMQRLSDHALRGARLRGEIPSPAVKRMAANAREGLTQARDQLMRAITEAINEACRR